MKTNDAQSLSLSLMTTTTAMVDGPTKLGPTTTIDFVIKLCPVLASIYDQTIHYSFSFSFALCVRACVRLVRAYTRLKPSKIKNKLPVRFICLVARIVLTVVVVVVTQNVK